MDVRLVALLYKADQIVGDEYIFEAEESLKIGKYIKAVGVFINFEELWSDKFAVRKAVRMLVDLMGENESNYCEFFILVKTCECIKIYFGFIDLREGKYIAKVTKKPILANFMGEEDWKIFEFPQEK